MRTSCLSNYGTSVRHRISRRVTNWPDRFTQSFFYLIRSFLFHVVDDSCCLKRRFLFGQESLNSTLHGSVTTITHDEVFFNVFFPATQRRHQKILFRPVTFSNDTAYPSRSSRNFLFHSLSALLTRVLVPVEESRKAGRENVCHMTIYPRH
jgi:hypothetical protein